MEDQAEVVTKTKTKTLRALDPESGYDDPQEGLRAEEIALRLNNKLNPKVLPTREYLDSEVSELVMKALHDLDQVRPENPVEFFAYYLLKHNPNAQA
mmetsp:Transcript_11817/g.17291  ORF Transcript_11817/g.17291 Transcript_11817/m.17291 type:complete len:97 (-) Transcript_11817:198-488(-)